MEITRGKILKAKKEVLYGGEGIGKSTFAAKHPDPLFIDTEEGTKEMDVARLPVPSSWKMLIEEVEYVRDNPDCCKTLVIDTADRAQKLAIDEMCSEHQCQSVEDPGYGKGYVYVYEKFGKLLNLLDEVIDRGINVLIVAHAAMRKFEQPDELGSYDRWEMKLVNSKNCNVSAMLKEWADMVLFVNYKTHVVSEDKDGKKKKALGPGQRVMYTTHHSCWDAKNRYGLPDELPFEYEAIAHIFAESVPKTEKSAQKVEKPSKNDEKTTKKEEKPSKEEKEPEKPSSELPEPSDRIPKALRDLMIHDRVTESDIKEACFIQGYWPRDMEVWDYPPDFIDGCLVAAWDAVKNIINTRVWQKVDPKDDPFDKLEY